MAPGALYEGVRLCRRGRPGGHCRFTDTCPATPFGNHQIPGGQESIGTRDCTAVDPTLIRKRADGRQGRTRGKLAFTNARGELVSQLSVNWDVPCCPVLAAHTMLTNGQGLLVIIARPSGLGRGTHIEIRATSKSRERRCRPGRRRRRHQWHARQRPYSSSRLGATGRASHCGVPPRLPVRGPCAYDCDLRPR